MTCSSRCPGTGAATIDAMTKLMDNMDGALAFNMSTDGSGNGLEGLNGTGGQDDGRYPYNWLVTCNAYLFIECSCGTYVSK